MEWQPIETAPKDGRVVILLDSGESYYPHGVLVAGFASGFWRDRDDYVVHKPSHWMPLPNPPKGE